METLIVPLGVGHHVLPKPLLPGDTLCPVLPSRLQLLLLSNTMRGSLWPLQDCGALLLRSCRRSQLQILLLWTTFTLGGNQ
ncbi:hypothetical protein AWZ03_008354 [Drosophila navojoa]|uniref:Uncharacterized protein n=1 Tax=Drosophila navojoa TaxID=7232 RepID=A0A484B966_DRONA|nr:hypothetical protein AWZ03_008354 [Drosophila navojoa]